MTKEIRKYFEYLLFFLINIFLWIPLYKQILLNCGYMAEFVSINILKANSREIAELDDPTGIIILFSIFFTILLIKPFLFHFLYILKNLFPNIHNFFDSIRINRKYMWGILCGTFALDIIGILFFNVGFWGFLGLSFNYILFLLFFIPVNKNNVNNGKIIKQQNLIMKIFTIVILSIITILILLAICPTIIIFCMRLFI